MTQMPDHAQARVLRFQTSLGECALRWRETGITAVVMPDPRALPAPRRARSAAAPELVRDAATAIVSLLDGERTDLSWVALEMAELQPFRRGVYAAAREIPAGATATYGQLATELGNPGFAREVGAALASNPFPIIVPCHRVLAADGALRGFSAPGGIETKRRMLEIENAPGFTQQALFA
ncbi:MAG: methylated-DNA-[protein]-cysteine S-methyltransferase [Solirubrobacteraceae bacterium]|jgi:methylated-DNA-[protein]-cysteine S-methyltransferase|nr:methylated-DNA--[protein]-cysteine S-methyltransferase [Solirubrobacterales bacterium]MEA2214679.1 methylated-DNA-[protein]-cysteine S-methyltransferase [Solirubrobacteraceae bacterium]